MPDPATPTLTQQPPTPADSAGNVGQALGAPDHTASPTEAQPEPQVAGEAPAEVEEQPEEPQAELPEGWDSHELVTTKLREAESAGYNKAKSHLTRAHSATMAEAEEVYRTELEQSRNAAVANAMVQTLTEKVQDFDLDDPQTVTDLRKTLFSNANWATVFDQTRSIDAQRGLVYAVTSDDRLTKGFSEEQADEFNAFVGELGLKLRGKVARAGTSEEAAKVYADALGSYLEERDKIRDQIVVQAALSKESKRLEDEARKAAGLTTRADSRSGQAPPVRPTGAGGGDRRPEGEILGDPKTPIQDLQKMLASKGIAT